MTKSTIATARTIPSVYASGAPDAFSDTPARIRSGPPADGAHTREVLAELGYDAVEIDELHASGAVGSRASRPQEHEG